MSDYDLRVGRIVFNGKGDIIYAQEGECSPNPLEYAPKGTLKELTQAQARIEKLEELVREMGEALQSSQIWLVNIKSHHSRNWSITTHGIWNDDYDNSDEILNRPEVKAMLEKAP